MRSTGHTAPRRRWWIAAAAALLVAAVGCLGFLPQVLSRTVARRLLISRARQVLAPGSLEARAVRLSWSGPTVIDGLVLRDGRGARLIASDRAIFGWNLWQILFQRPATASLTLPGAEVRVERLADGRIDLYETIRPMISEHPERRLVVEIPGGRLRFGDPALAEPLVADRADIHLDLPRDPDPIEWNVALRRDPGAGEDPGQMLFKGRLERPGDGVATLSLEAARWPWVVAVSGRPARGVLDGRLAAERRDSRWTIRGDATASDRAAAVADANQSTEAPRFGPIRAAWDLEERDGSWTARRLDLVMPYARITGEGTVARSGRVARVDLKGSLSPDWEAIQADLRRQVEPRARIAGRPREWRLAGSLGPAPAGDRLADLVGEVGVRLDALDVYGMRLSETSVVLRVDRGRFRFDPIDARLNDGALHLVPEVVRPEDGPIRIELGGASTLADAVVNDEVSHRVLSYIAPVLDGATRVRGRISVRRLDAEFPLGASAEASARVEGDAVFDDVSFLPGPLAEAIVELVPRPRDAGTGERPLLVLRDPIAFRIADRKVEQHGLKIPLGRIGSAGLEGSVDFERRLDLVARFRVNPPGEDRPVLATLLNDARFELPIGGTLDHPRIDEEALKAGLRSLGSDMLENSILAGAGGLLRLLDGLPRRHEVRKPSADGPPAVPPPAADRPGQRSAEERRQLRERRRLERLEKKAQRRMRREGSPE